MDSQIVQKLIFQAASEGSVDVLNDVIQQHGPLSKVIANLTVCNDEGDTPLYVAIRNGHDKMVEFILAKIQECIVSSINVTHCKTKTTLFWQGKPSIRMAHCLGICEHVPVMYIMEHLIGNIMPNYLPWLDFVLNCVIESNISRSEKIIALELLGSAFIFLHSQHPPEKTGCRQGLYCWNEAMILRYSTVNTIPKIPHDSSEIARNAYGGVVEWMTVQQLEHLMKEQCSFRGFLKEWEAICMAPLRIQALLVLERTFKQNQRDSPNSFHLKFLLDYVYECEARKQFTKVINISLLILEECIDLKQTSSAKCIDIFIQTFIIIFDCLMQPNTSKEKFSNSNFLLIVKLSSKILTNLSTGPDMPIIDPKFQKYGVLKKFVKLIAVWLSWLNDEEQRQLEEHLHEFIRLGVPDGYSSPLHYAIWVFVSHGVVISLNAVKVIRLFLRLGANPNTFDQNGKTPMHCLANHWCWMIYLDLYLTVFQSLVDAGGRLDKATPEGETVMSILKEQRIKLSPHINRFDPYLESMMNTVLPFSLSDLCAQVIRHRQVAYENQLPCSLQSFVRRDYTVHRKYF
ncbi:protein fem-1 homolog C-like [Daphnia carinata]|uniref:protein fem-1 homolog C-like n=1 Tax=Daphnia carinata TaxID=120202 RepID=UPI00257F95D7|nr:protein fem-1 homolog C-like [Daphnia carinata]